MAAVVPPAPAKRRWGWKATALTVILLIGAGMAGSKFDLFKLLKGDTSTVAKATQPTSDATIERGFAEIVQSAQLPKKLDDFTTRFDVTPAGKRLVFHHIIDTSRYLMPPNFAAVMKDKMLPEACANASREALKAGGTLEYRFHSQAAVPVGSFEIKNADCGNGQPKG